MLEASEPCADDVGFAQDEDIFVAQLLRRARLLDAGLYATVRQAVADFERASTESGHKSMPMLGAEQDGSSPSVGSEQATLAPAVLDERGPVLRDLPGGRRSSRQGGEQRTSSPFVAKEAGATMLRRGSSVSQSGLSLSGWLFTSAESDDTQGRRRSSIVSRLASVVSRRGSSFEGPGFENAMSKRGGIMKRGGLASDVCFPGCSGPKALEVEWAPIKTAARMREKLAEYAAEGAAWPRAACILDPVRGSIVCAGPARMLEVLAWFEERQAKTGLQLVRVKNKFGFRVEELVGGYRDVMLSVVYRSPSGLAIVGEIQVRILLSWKATTSSARKLQGSRMRLQFPVPI